MKRILHYFFAIALFPLSVAAQDIKVMSYNLRFDNPGDGVNAWPARKQKVFDVIRKYSPDIIGVQEALKHQLDDLVGALPEYTYVGTGRDDGKTKGEYSAILYRRDRFSAEGAKTTWLSETPSVPGSKSWDAAITRVVTETKFTDKQTKRSFYYINTHFDHIGTEARKQSAIILRKKAETLKIPVIISGDLNCTRTEPPYQALMEKGKLIDPAPENAPGTFCTFVVNGPACTPIDYVLHTSEWKSQKYAVISDNDGKHYPSDHLPVMVTLSLKR